LETSVSIKAKWRDLGELSLDHANKLKFPRASELPGLYCFDLINQHATYVGETDNLMRRLQHYRTPGPSQLTNIRLNALLSDALRDLSERISIRICEGAKIVIGHQERAADFRKKFERVLVEHAILVAAVSTGVSILNTRA
jgi:hypothetical protein